MATRNKNVLKRYELIQQETMKYYEPGNQSKSKAQAFRQHVSKVYPMGERTFWRIMGMDIKREMTTANNGQLTLQFD